MTAAAFANSAAISNPNAMLHSDASFVSATSCTKAISLNLRPGFRYSKQFAHAPCSKQPRTSSDFRKSKKLSSLQENATAHFTGNFRDPTFYSKISNVMASKKSNREPSQAAANSNSIVCYKYGKRGHILSVYNPKSKPVDVSRAADSGL